MNMVDDPKPKAELRDEDLHEFRIVEKDMSRSQQTTIILMALALMGVLYLIFQETRMDPNSPYAKCQRLFWTDRACVNEVLNERLSYMGI